MLASLSRIRQRTLASIATHPGNTTRWDNSHIYAIVSYRIVSFRDQHKKNTPISSQQPARQPPGKAIISSSLTAGERENLPPFCLLRPRKKTLSRSSIGPLFRNSHTYLLCMRLLAILSDLPPCQRKLYPRPTTMASKPKHRPTVASVGGCRLAPLDLAAPCPRLQDTQNTHNSHNEQNNRGLYS